MFRKLVSPKLLKLCSLRLRHSSFSRSLCGTLSFDFSKSVASKLKPPTNKQKYEESEKDLEDIITMNEPSDNEAVDLDAKDEWDLEKPGRRGSVTDKENYHFIVEKDPAKAALNIQNFIMKASEKLQANNLREFLHTAESFKSKIVTSDYRLTKRTKDKNFFKKCCRIFEKDNAGDLVYLLMVCDINRISHENFSSTVFNFDEEIELKNKITKFNEFSYTQIPKAKPLITDLEAKHKRAMNIEQIKTEDQSDLNLLSKISKIKFQTDNQNQTSTMKPKSTTITGFVNDLEDNIEDDKTRNQTDKLILEMVNNEIEKNLSSELNYTEEIKQDVILNQEQTANALNFNHHIEKMRNFLHDTYPMKQEVRLQQPKEILILQQKNFSKREIVKTNWVYVSGLPYSIENTEEMERLLKEKFERFAGKIKNIKIFLYKDFLSVKQDDLRTYSITPKANIESIFLPPFQSSTKHEDELPYEENQPTEQIKPTPTIGEILKSLKIDVGDDTATGSEKLELQAQKKKSRKTEKILTNIKEKSSKKLDRSYALLEFANAEGKEKALLPELRVFGIKIDKNMVVTDDADYKLTLICNNVHWGASLEKFCEKLNEQFEKHHVLDLQIEVSPEDAKKIITKYFLLLRFNNFPSTVKALYALRDSVFENRLLRLGHLYGSLKKFKTNYYEILDSESFNEIIGKVNERKMFEISRISNATEEENIPQEATPDLLLEEGMNPILENEEEYPPFFMHEHPDEEAIEEKYKRNYKKFTENEEIERLERERFH